MDPDSVGVPHRTRIQVVASVSLSVLAWPAEDSVATAPSIVLLHGIASTARSWDPVAGSLAAAGHAVFAADFRGHGESDAPVDGYDLQTFAADLVVSVDRLGDRLGGGLPVLVGHSLGAMVVLEAVKLAPGLAGGVVLVEGGLVDASVQFASLDECLARLKLPRVDGMPRARVEGFLRATNPGWSEERLAGTMAAFRAEPDGTLRWRLTAPHFELLIRSMWAQHASQLWPVVASPTLVVAADTGDDVWTEQKRNAAAAAGRALPRGRVRWLKGDHDIHAQRPQDVADLILEAVAEGFFASGPAS